MSVDCFDKRDFVDKHNVNAESDFLFIFQDIFEHDQIIDYHWLRLRPGSFPFQRMNVSYINFIGTNNITCGDRKVQNEVLGNDSFEVSS